MRKLLVLANTLVQQDRIWTEHPPREYSHPHLPHALPREERSWMIEPQKTGHRNRAVPR